MVVFLTIAYTSVCGFSILRNLKEPAAFHQLMISHTVQDRVLFPARYQDSFVFHQAKVLGCVLHRRIDRFSNVPYR